MLASLAFTEQGGKQFSNYCIVFVALNIYVILYFAKKEMSFGFLQNLPGPMEMKLYLNCKSGSTLSKQLEFSDFAGTRDFLSIRQRKQQKTLNFQLKMLLELKKWSKTKLDKGR